MNKSATSVDGSYVGDGMIEGTEKEKGVTASKKLGGAPEISKLYARHE